MHRDTKRRYAAELPASGVASREKEPSLFDINCVIFSKNMRNLLNCKTIMSI